MYFGDIGDVLRSRPRDEAEELIRLQTRNAYLGGGRLLCIVLGKYKMYVQADDIGFAPHMIFEGFWEYWLTVFMARTIGRGDVAWDVGANLGYYSILMSDLVGADGQVVCIEPNLAIARELQSSLALNGFAGRTEVHVCALTEEADGSEATFFVPDHEPKNGMLVAEPRATGGLTTTVSTRNINAMAVERLDFMKIDVEGSELSILRSLPDIKARLKPDIVAEVNFSRGYDYDDVLALLGHSGSLLHVDFDGTAVPLTPEMAKTERLGDDWLVFWPGRSQR